jgi:hypothetical protein
MNDHPLPTAIDRLLDEERQAPPPPPEVAARVLRRLHRTLGLSGGPASLLAGKTYLIALLVVGGATWVLVRSRPPVGVTATASPIAPPAPTVVIQPLAVSPAPPSAPRPPRADDLAQESALLLEARRALASGETAAALSMVRRHGRRWPHGALEQEREILLMEALARAGRPEAAQRRARAFLRRFPSSTLAETARTHR